jgi:ArsR family transcriptional regulator
MSGDMDIIAAVPALQALGQPTRLETFRLLVRCEPDGVPAGEISAKLRVPHNTLSSHLNILSQAKLVRSERRGRSILYRADLDAFRELAAFLLADCCGGRAELCEPLIELLRPSRQPETRCA